MFIKLYNKCLELASHKSSNYFLAVVSFLESSFFPIPPDVMIIPMVVAKKRSFLKIFIIATIFSVLGGMVGYLLGAYFYDVAIPIVEFYGYEKKMLNIKYALTEGKGFYNWLTYNISCWFYTFALQSIYYRKWLNKF